MLAQWNPFSGSIARSSSPMPAFDELFKEADALLRNSLLGDTVLPRAWEVAASYTPPAEMIETEDGVQLLVDLPGHDVSSLQVKVEGDVLTLQSERKPLNADKPGNPLCSERPYGVFARSFTLPDGIDGSRCEARYENGVLAVTLPKREDARPKTIHVKVQS